LLLLLLLPLLLPFCEHHSSFGDVTMAEIAVFLRLLLLYMLLSPRGATWALA